MIGDSHFQMNGGGISVEFANPAVGAMQEGGLVANNEKRGLWFQTPLECFGWTDDYAPVGVLVGLDCALEAGLSVAFPRPLS